MTSFLKFTLCLISTIVILQSCKKDDPVLEDENELIHQVKIQFTDNENQNTYTWEDGLSDTILLQSDREYTVQVYFFSLEKDQNSIDITDEIIEESDAHQVFYTTDPNDLLSITYKDKDINNLPLGIQTNITSSIDSKEGNLRIQLKHYSVAKDGNPASGSTDVDVKFPVIIQ